MPMYVHVCMHVRIYACVLIFSLNNDVAESDQHKPFGNTSSKQTCKNLISQRKCCQYIKHGSYFAPKMDHFLLVFLPKFYNQIFTGRLLDYYNYRGLKLIEHALKVFERVIENLLRQIRVKVAIGSMQFGFMPGKRTTDAIFVVRQVQERFMNKKRPLFFAFVDLEKAFDRVPRAVLEWSLRELIVDDWLIKVIMSMYKNARSSVSVNGKLGEEFEVKVGVHQGSVLSPILLAIVLKALSRGFSDGLPWELLYADDLVIMADSLDELSVKLERWKAELSAKGLKVNTKKTKIMISKPGAGLVQKTGKYPCSVCSKGVGSNSIQCTKCKQWVHARCSRVKGKLAKVKDFVCNSCSSPPLDM